MKLRYIKEYRDRLGKTRRYFRKKGLLGVALPGHPGSAQFMKAYAEALEGAAVENPVKAARIDRNAGVIYFLDDGDFIKIGFSTNLDERLKSYRTHRASGLNLVAMIPGARPDDDQQLRRRFVNLRARGDWFRKGPALVAFVEKIKNESNKNR